MAKLKSMSKSNGAASKSCCCCSSCCCYCCAVAKHPHPYGHAHARSHTHIQQISTLPIFSILSVAFLSRPQSKLSPMKNVQGNGVEPCTYATTTTTAAATTTKTMHHAYTCICIYVCNTPTQAQAFGSILFLAFFPYLIP